MATYELISFELCPYAARARTVLLEKQVPHELTYIDLSNPPDWFKPISPLGKVPVLRVDGHVLFESQVICEYIDETTPGSLHPADAILRAENRAWIEFAGEMLKASREYMGAGDDETFKSTGDVLKHMFEMLASNLSKKPFFNGDQFNMIDAAFAPLFRWHTILAERYDPGFLTVSDDMSRWRDALLQQPSVKNSVVDTYSDKFLQSIHNRESVLAGKL